METEIHPVGEKEVAKGELSILNARDVRDYNDFDIPNRVTLMKEPVKESS